MSSPGAVALERNSTDKENQRFEDPAVRSNAPQNPGDVFLYFKSCETIYYAQEKAGR